MILHESDKKWIRLKWDKIRRSQQMADRADVDWNRINDEINAKHDAENARRAATGRPPLTDLLIAQAKSDSLPLNDALAAGNWHSRNAERHIHDVMLFLKLKELNVL